MDADVSGLRALVRMERAHAREVRAAGRRGARACVIRDRLRRVPALPPGEPQAPREVDVVLVHEEALVEVFAANLHGLERFSPGDERSAADSEHLLLGLVLPDVLEVLATIRGSTI